MNEKRKVGRPKGSKNKEGVKTGRPKGSTGSYKPVEKVRKNNLGFKVSDVELEEIKEIREYKEFKGLSNRAFFIELVKQYKLIKNDKKKTN